MSSFVVAGGGIGGLTVALALAQKDHAVTVLEKRDAFSEIGAGLQLAPNALRALAKLGLYESIHDFAWFPQRLVLGDAQTGQELSTLEMDKTFHTRYGFPYAVMHRADLLDLLYRACVAAGVDLKPGHEVDEIVDESRSVHVICRQGTTLKADAVIAADGLWSRLRSLVSDDAPVQEPYVAYRGTVAVADMGDLVRMDDVVMWIGPGLHFVQYPVRRGELYNQVAVFRSDRFRSEHDDWGTPEELDTAFSAVAPDLKRAAHFMQRGRRWPMLHRRPLASWTRGRMTLLGDAAHPMLQYIAQGACQAIEDALTLAESVTMDSDNLPLALRRYEDRRIPRTAAVQRAAQTFGDIIHHDDPTAVLLRNHLLRQRSPWDFQPVDWLYRHDPAPTWPIQG